MPKPLLIKNVVNLSRRLLFVCLFLMACSRLSAITVTGSVFTASGTATTNSRVAFIPQSTLPVLIGGTWYISRAVTVTATNGFFTTPLVIGKYNMVVDQSTRDQLTIYAPNDTNTYSFRDLTTNNISFALSNYFGFIISPVKTNGVQVGTNAFKFNFVSGITGYVNGTEYYLGVSSAGGASSGDLTYFTNWTDAVSNKVFVNDAYFTNWVNAVSNKYYLTGIHFTNWTAALSNLTAAATNGFVWSLAGRGTNNTFKDATNTGATTFTGTQSGLNVTGPNYFADWRDQTFWGGGGTLYVDTIRFGNIGMKDGSPGAFTGGQITADAASGFEHFFRGTNADNVIRVKNLSGELHSTLVFEHFSGYGGSGAPTALGWGNHSGTYSNCLFIAVNPRDGVAIGDEKIMAAVHGVYQGSLAQRAHPAWSVLATNMTKVLAYQFFPNTGLGNAPGDDPAFLTQGTNFAVHVTSNNLLFVSVPATFSGVVTSSAGLYLPGGEVGTNLAARAVASEVTTALAGKMSALGGTNSSFSNMVVSGYMFTNTSTTNLSIHRIGGATNTGLTIDGLGNVGIGTNNPTSKLKIVGTGAANYPGEAVLDITATDDAAYVWGSIALAPNLSAGNQIVSPFVGVARSTRNSGYMGFKYASSGSTANALTWGFYGDAADRITLLASGNVGIGTANPAAQLDVPGTAAIGTLRATNITGLSTNSLLVVSTNFISGKLYTNTTSGAILVSANAAIHVAAVNGQASVALQVWASPATGGTTNVSGISSLITSIAMDYTNTLSAVVPTNSVYCFTNLSSGAGNTATVTGGQISYVQQQVIAPPTTYKVYRALLTQTGTDAPVATVLENTLGGTVVFARTAGGRFTVTLAGAFLENKTFARITPNFTAEPVFMAALSRTSENVLALVSGNITSESFMDDVMTASPIEILVYP